LRAEHNQRAPSVHGCNVDRLHVYKIQIDG
jgi:hypothetical protein